MGVNPLPLSIIADVTVITSSPQVAAPNFNVGLVVGPTVAIPSYGTNPRVRIYLAATFSTAMIADGYTTSSPEYICAQIYFSQSPQPQRICIGRQDLTAINTMVYDTGGTGYAVGDTFTVTQGGASFGIGRVTAVTAGVPTAVAVVPGSQGTGYAVFTGLSTVAIAPATGTGLEINITVIGETALQAVMACRLISPIWYPCMVTD